jgi:hypothetical protein
MPPRPEDQAAEDIGLGERSPTAQGTIMHISEKHHGHSYAKRYNDTYRKAGQDEKEKKSTVLFCNAVVPQP